jgi:hypothetical protein
VPGRDPGGAPSALATKLTLAGLRAFPWPTKALLAVLSASGVAEVAHLLTEALTWTAEVSRRKAAR